MNLNEDNNLQKNKLQIIKIFFFKNKIKRAQLNSS